METYYYLIYLSITVNLFESFKYRIILKERRYKVLHEITLIS